MPKKYPREIRHYDEDFKRQAVKLYHKTGKSFSEIGEELGDVKYLMLLVSKANDSLSMVQLYF